MNDLNLNAYLFPNNSPYVQNSGQTSGYAFDYENEAGVISNGKIRNLSADKITSGTIDASVITVNNLTIGPEDINSGTLNSTMNVGTAAGTAYVKIDGSNNRIIINDGSNDRILIGYQSGGF